MQEITARLLSMQDEAYRAFHEKLVPGLRSPMIGVRVPQIRQLARELQKAGQSEEFLAELPHVYYEENMLHAQLLNLERDFDRAMEDTQRFLPFVDNWAVCDSLCPKVFAKRPQELLTKIRRWLSSSHTYTVRFAVTLLMKLYLGEHFSPEQLEMVSEIRTEEYYINMARAWYFATALAQREEAALPWILENRLDIWTHNKAIQKAIESYRISPELKALLRAKKR